MSNSQSVTPNELAGVVREIRGQIKDLGGLTVRRVLPVVEQRQLGPFVFLDHIGPATLAAGQGLNVRPHPHIGLATITYLLEGEFVHRDSLGSEQLIRPGDVNWMAAGRGIVHSERAAPEVLQDGGRLHGVQTWVALPLAHEQSEPRFEHHAIAALPKLDLPGASLRVIAGSAYGLRAPTGVLSPTLYVHARLEPGASLDVDDEHPERGVLLLDGRVECAGRTLEGGTLLVLAENSPIRLNALAASNVLLLGGAPLEGARHVWWNFVASSRELIEQAKARWRAGQFDRIPTDALEFIPLPDGS